MKGNPLFIVDDEADAASLNTLINRDKQSSINKYLDTIKKEHQATCICRSQGHRRQFFFKQ